MSASLRAFVTKALDRNRISFGDLRRLQRNVLPNGLVTREQAEVLIALEQTIPRTDKAWAGYLVAALTDFVVWRSSSPGRVETETAAWLVASLSCGRPTRTTGMIARAIVREAQHCEEPLIGFALTSPKRLSAHPEPMTGRGEQALPAPGVETVTALGSTRPAPWPQRAFWRSPPANRAASRQINPQDAAADRASPAGVTTTRKGGFGSTREWRCARQLNSARMSLRTVGRWAAMSWHSPMPRPHSVR